MLVSQNKLAELTGKDRKTIQKLLAERPAQSGPHRAILYDSARALETIYCANGDGTFVSTAEAFRQLTLAKRTQIELQNAKFRDEFWPRAEIEFLMRHAMAVVVQTLKANVGRSLTFQSVNDLLADFRAAFAHMREDGDELERRYEQEKEKAKTANGCGQRSGAEESTRDGQ
jgi:hypothetical protein